MDKPHTLVNKIKHNMPKIHINIEKVKQMSKYIWGTIIFIICILIGIWIYKKDILKTSNDNKMVSTLDKQSNYIKISMEMTLHISIN